MAAPPPADSGCAVGLPWRRDGVKADPRDRLLLFGIRTIHSAIFLVELGSIAWLVLTGLANRRDRSVAIAGGLVAVESAVFVLNDRVCPLTPLAERHGAVRGSVSDIFLPDVVARTIPIWSTALLALALVLHLRGIKAGAGRPSRPAQEPRS
jgi:hypothetical protein